MSLWARRKAAVAAEARAEAQARQAAARQAEEQALAERSDEELLAEAGVKAPEDLADAAEIRAFLSQALPERLKRRALRRLWGTNPVLACVDGLNDYDEDYTDAAAGGPVRTGYVVGKGMPERFRAFVEPEKEAGDVAGEAVTPGAETSAEGKTHPSRTCSGTSSRIAAVEVPEQVRDGWAQDGDAAPEAQEEDAADPPATCRRMRFTFERAT